MSPDYAECGRSVSGRILKILGISERPKILQLCYFFPRRKLSPTQKQQTQLREKTPSQTGQSRQLVGRGSPIRSIVFGFGNWKVRVPAVSTFKKHPKGCVISGQPAKTVI
jgi:hypothetical protein